MVIPGRREINQWKKMEFIFEESKKKDDDIIKKYADKYNNRLITWDWAYKKIKERNSQRFWSKVYKVD